MQCKSSQKHKHCKPNCVMHNSFAKSLRKYDKTFHKRTPSSYAKNTEIQKQLNRKQSLITLIKPFKSVMQPTQYQQSKDNNKEKYQFSNDGSINRSQIQSYLLKISLPNKEKHIQEFHNKPLQQGICQKSKSAQLSQKYQIKDQRDSKTTKWDITFSAQNSVNDFKQEQMNIVKSKDLKQLQFNVQRISSIIDNFNKKLGKYEPPMKPFNENDQNNISKHQEKPGYTQNLYDSPFNSNVFANVSISNEFPKQVSPIHQYSQEYKVIEANAKQNLSQAPSTSNGKSVIDSTKLNYKMYNWSTKIQSLGSSRRKKGKCHGSAGAFAI